MYHFTKEELIYTPDDLKAENDRLVKEYFDNKDSLDINCFEYFDLHATERYKEWSRQSLAYAKELRKQGIIYD